MNKTTKRLLKGLTVMYMCAIIGTAGLVLSQSNLIMGGVIVVFSTLALVLLLTFWYGIEEEKVCQD
jgi:hypothetical protein